MASSIFTKDAKTDSMPDTTGTDSHLSLSDLLVGFISPAESVKRKRQLTLSQDSNGFLVGADRPTKRAKKSDRIPFSTSSVANLGQEPEDGMNASFLKDSDSIDDVGRTAKKAKRKVSQKIFSQSQSTSAMVKVEERSSSFRVQFLSSCPLAPTTDVSVPAYNDTPNHDTSTTLIPAENKYTSLCSLLRSIRSRPIKEDSDILDTAILALATYPAFAAQLDTVLLLMGGKVDISCLSHILDASPSVYKFVRDEATGEFQEILGDSEVPVLTESETQYYAYNDSFDRQAGNTDRLQRVKFMRAEFMRLAVMYS